MSGSTTLRSAWLVGVAAVGLVLMGLYPHGFTAARTAAVAHPATATIPASGTIYGSGGPTFIDFEAPNRAGAATGPGDCTAVVVSGTTASNCSNFLLTVSTPGSQVVRVRLDWSRVTNDYDLYIFDQTTTGQVASSGNGTTTFEEATFTPVAGRTYEVLIVNFAAAPLDNIKGRASLVSAPTVTTATRLGPRGTGIVFSRNGNIQTTAGEAPTGKGTLFAKETVRDGEPSIRADLLGNVYPAGIRGVPAGVDVWRYGPKAYCPLFTFHTAIEFPGPGQDPADGYVWLGQPDALFGTGEGSPDAGGGDIEIATSFPQAPTLDNPPTLSMVSLTLANVTGAKSLNRGNTWAPVHKNPLAANAPPVDRQWIEAFGRDNVYLYYRTLSTLTGLVLQKSMDGGVTYEAAKTVVNPLGFTPGWIDVDQTLNGEGGVDIYLSAQNSSKNVVFHCVDATPAFLGGVSCGGPQTVDNSMSHGHLFDVVNVDKAHNVYVAWSNNQDIFYAYSTDKAATWSSPIKITNAGVSGPNFNFFPWITAGDDGRLGIVWYGTDKLTNGDNDAEWKAYYAFTADARATTPTIYWLPASDHFIHKSNVSQSGFGTDAAVNRNLIDFFQVAHDPRDGAAVIAFADDHNDFDGATYYTRQIAGPGLLAPPTSPTHPASCPPLTPFRNPEVRDFAGDVTTVSGTGVPDPLVDILSIDYGSKTVGANLYLMADMALAQMTSPPPPKVSYRMYFAVNTVRGLMDAGNEYFIEMTTRNTTPEFWLGVTDRTKNGGTNEMRVERIEADQIGQAFEADAPGHVRVRVNVNRLHYRFNGDLGTVDASGSTAPGVGALVIGLRGRVRLDAGTATSLLDQTRGGSFIILGARDVTQPPTPEECADDDVSGDSPNRGVRDFDHDGLDDACADKDDDNDGIRDDQDDDHDNDGIKNAADPDDDNDGISDYLELGVVNGLYLLLIRR